MTGSTGRAAAERVPARIIIGAVRARTEVARSRLWSFFFRRLTRCFGEPIKTRRGGARLSHPILTALPYRRLAPLRSTLIHSAAAPYAAPGLGILTGALMLLLGWQWLERRARILGPGYGPHDVATPGTDRLHNPPAPMLAALPLRMVIALNLAFTFVIISALDIGILAQSEYGATDVDSLRGVWSIIAALTLSDRAVCREERSTPCRFRTASPRQERFMPSHRRAR